MDGGQKRRGGPARRAVLPALALAAGAAGIVYGALFHAQEVLPKQEPPSPQTGVPPETLPESEAPAFSPDELFGPPPAGEGPLVIEIGPGAGVLETEPQVIHEVTIGGLVRLDTGEIARTYDPAKGVPSTCPT